jgi:hypothetical protein
MARHDLRDPPGRKHYPDGHQLRAYCTDEQLARYRAGARAAGAPNLSVWVRYTLDQAAALACAAVRDPEMDAPDWVRQMPLALRATASREKLLRGLDLQIALGRVVRDHVFRCRRADDVGI